MTDQMPQVNAEFGTTPVIEFPTPEAPKGLKVVELTEGDGPIVRRGDTVTVNYHGVVWGKDTPFDSSYCKVITNQRYWVSKTNDLLTAGFYNFGADGKMTDAPIPTPDPDPDPNPDPEKRTGCSFDDFIALKNKKNIGEGIDKIIARLAEVNDSLKGVIDIAHFNDEAKIGKGQEMVDKLTKLIAIFQRPELDFSNNKADGDDIIGDAYEYLMRNFATESGKSKGQFYTPAEVSRILAKVIGIDKCTDHDATVCEKAVA